MIWLSWQFTLLVLVVAPVIGWIMRGINRRFRRHSARIQQSMGDVTRVAKEAIEGHRVIKVFTAEDAQQQRFEDVNEHNRRSNVRLINAKAASTPVVQMVAALALAAVLAVAIARGEPARRCGWMMFISYISAMMMVMAPLRRLVNVSSQLQQGIAAGASLFEVLDTAREPGTGGLALAACHGAKWNSGMRIHLRRRCRAGAAAGQCRQWARARRWPSWASPAAASPRWWAWCRGCTT